MCLQGIAQLSHALSRTLFPPSNTASTKKGAKDANVWIESGVILATALLGSPSTILSLRLRFDFATLRGRSSDVF